MSSPEAPIGVRMIRSRIVYDTYLLECSVYNVGDSRAVGLTFSNGYREAVIDSSFYLAVGITEEELGAIIAHEIEELSHPDIERALRHRMGVIAEYRYILDRWGRESLVSYHDRIVAAIGDRQVRDETLAQFMD